ncbi:MAG: hypothetical protein CSA62_09560 [Planctomycetota bacterium]|nr:MAG: hypothetical protein CSA62_09560 [Planctomycetota bacterium]
MNTTHNRLAVLIRELTVQLKAQEGEIRSLTAAMKERRNFFVSADAELLDRTNAELEQLASRLFELEQQRLQTMRNISEYVGVPIPALTSSRLSGVVTGGEGRALAEQARRTKSAAEQLHIENKVGESLLDWSARWHEGLLQELAKTIKDAPTYARNGKSTPKSKQGLLDAWV